MQRFGRGPHSQILPAPLITPETSEAEGGRKNQRSSKNPRYTCFYTVEQEQLGPQASFTPFSPSCMGFCFPAVDTDAAVSCHVSGFGERDASSERPRRET